MDLAPTVDPTFVQKVVAQVLGISEAASESLTETLHVRLRTVRALLILDNCEHLLEACADLVESLLQETSNLRILTTSREALHVVGEQCYQLSPLSLPASSVNPDTLCESEAVALFVERARLQQQGYVVTAQRTRAVAELCVRLDGMPLALELAAARIRASARRKDRRAAERQVPIVDRRHAQFAAAPQNAACDDRVELRSSVRASKNALRTSFDLSGRIQPRSGRSGHGRQWDPQNDVLDLLSTLIDKSLVLVEASGERYRLLETIRQFARERLQASGEEAALRERHFDWYLRLVTRIEPSLAGGPQQKLALDALEADHDNVRAALAWSLEAPERADSALRLCGVLYRFWSRRGYWREGYTACMKALAQAGGSSDKAARAKVLLTAAVSATTYPEPRRSCFCKTPLRSVGNQKTAARRPWR